MKTRKFKFIIAALIAYFPLSVSAAGKNIVDYVELSSAMMLTIMLGIILFLLLLMLVLTKSIQSIAAMKKSELQKKSRAIKSIALFVLGTYTFSAQAAGETAELSKTFVLSDTLFWILLTAIVILSVMNSFFYRSFQTILKHKRDEYSEKKLVDPLYVQPTESVEDEEEAMMLDHVYDGIRELDNDLPPWWKYMFYATIVFAFVYLFRFHISGDGKLSLEEYMAEMEQAEIEKAATMASAGESINEDNAQYLVDAVSLEKGAGIFKMSCGTCHGQLGEGGAGPNLTDEYWLHGGGIKEVFATIKYGVPAKGMIPWESQLSPSQIQEVASYVLSLKGSNPPNAKDPQGELYSQTEAVMVDSSQVIQ